MQIGVFRNGVGAESTGVVDRFGAPSAQCAGNHRDAIQQIECALFQVLASHIFKRLPAREPADAVSDFHISGDGAYARVGKMPH